MLARASAVEWQIRDGQPSHNTEAVCNVQYRHRKPDCPSVQWARPRRSQKLPSGCQSSAGNITTMRLGIRLGLPRPGAEALEATPVVKNHKKRQNVRWLTDVWGNAFKIADHSFQEQRGDKAILSRIRCATKLVASRSGYLASCRWRCAREGTDGSA
jgi:hypothetical protein